MDNRRLSPKIWHHDYYCMNLLRQKISETVANYGLTKITATIVDIGCGDRPYEPLFTVNDCQYIGCDLSGKPDILIETGKTIPIADDSCDGVVSFQVLEHVWDLDWYLGECYRILKPGGWLLLSTHGNWLYHPHPTDFRRWTKEGLTQEINTRRFHLVSIEAVVGPLAWTTQFRLLGYYVALQKLGLLGKIILIPLSCFMNLRMIIEDWITPKQIRDNNACVYVTLANKKL